jgi:hypothetical protein
MRGGTVRVTIAAGFLAVVMLSALGPSMAAAVEAAEDQPAPAARVKPMNRASEPAPPKLVPPQATPPHPTPKPKPAPTPKPRPKPKPTPPGQTPGQRGPDGQAPGDPKPVRSDEPPTAPVLPPGEQPSTQPGAPADLPGGGAGSTPTGHRAGIGPLPSKVQLVVAGATVSGIAAVAGWLVLGGRRRERPPQRPPVRVSQPPGTNVTLADGMQLDLEVVVNRPDGAPPPRYAGRVPAAAANTLWRDQDDRPRWVRRFDEQGPARPRVPRTSLGVEDGDED